MSRHLTRRRMLTGLTLGAPALLLGYERIGANPAFQANVLCVGEWLSYRVQRLIGGDLAVGHGAPIRLRVERQLGYKHAKYIMQIEAVSTLAATAGGRGWFWEDYAGYNWCAGI